MCTCNIEILNINPIYSYSTQWFSSTVGLALTTLWVFRFLLATHLIVVHMTTKATARNLHVMYACVL